MTKIAATDDVRQLLAASAAASPWAPVIGVGDNLAGATVWLAEVGPRAALIATRGAVRQHGRLLEVVAMRSLGERVHAQDVAAVVGQIGREFYDNVDLVAMCTRHEHLARCIQRAGWARSGYVLTQQIGQVH